MSSSTNVSTTVPNPSQRLYVELLDATAGADIVGEGSGHSQRHAGMGQKDGWSQQSVCSCLLVGIFSHLQPCRSQSKRLDGRRVVWMGAATLCDRSFPCSFFYHSHPLRPFSSSFASRTATTNTLGFTATRSQSSSPTVTTYHIYTMRLR